MGHVDADALAHVPNLPTLTVSPALPGKAPMLDGFGPHVVTKPDFDARSADVRLERR